MKKIKIGELVSIHRRGSRWHVNYQFQGQQHRKSLGTSSLKLARHRALGIEREIITGNSPPSRRPPSLRSVIADFEQSKVAQGLAPKTLQKYRHCFRVALQLSEELNLQRIDQITPYYMDRFRAHRVSNLSRRVGRDGQKTATNDMVTLREVVNYALARKLIAHDPLEGYVIKEPKPKPQPYWVQEQLDDILARARRQPHGDIFKLLAFTGMRIGEVQHLTWADVDLDNRVIHVQAKTAWKPKTGDARSIPMSQEVVDVLSRQPRRVEWIFSFQPTANRDARQIRQRRLLDYLKRHLKKLNLRGHLHTFRHTFISLALTRGVPEATVRSWVGHVDREIMQRYTHIASQDSHAAMQRLEESLGARRTRTLKGFGD